MIINKLLKIIKIILWSKPNRLISEMGMNHHEGDSNRIESFAKNHESNRIESPPFKLFNESNRIESKGYMNRIESNH